MTRDIPALLRARDSLKKASRAFFERQGYLEVDTPVVTHCPGTEVYLHYFDTSWTDHGGLTHQKFLRSSPELHMKRLMAEGLRKSFQLAPCFRNRGEFSEWHNPEFTMLEWYQMGLSYRGLIHETEVYLRETAETMAILTGVRPEAVLPGKFEIIGVFDAFKSMVGVDLVDGDPDLAKKVIAAGVYSVQPGDDFETAYFKSLIEKIEPVIAGLKGCVLMDYPPSQAALAVVEGGQASRFEYYLGRVEICNGFFELTGESENRARVGEAFMERAKMGFPPVPEDEDFYKAMGRFSGPCSGNALGFDRWLALLRGADSLDGSIAFRGV
ncbi:MAG: amino acid--tRNA ligase-related protein [Pseudomonadota bacterium]